MPTDHTSRSGQGSSGELDVNMKNSKPTPTVAPNASVCHAFPFTLIQ